MKTFATAIPIIFVVLSAPDLGRLLRSPAPFAEFLNGALGPWAGKALSAGEYVSSRKHWNDFARALGRFHQTYDLYLIPSTAMPRLTASGTTWV